MILKESLKLERIDLSEKDWDRIWTIATTRHAVSQHRYLAECDGDMDPRRAAESLFSELADAADIYLHLQEIIRSGSLNIIARCPDSAPAAIHFTGTKDGELELSEVHLGDQAVDS